MLLVSLAFIAALDLVAGSRPLLAAPVAQVQQTRDAPGSRPPSRPALQGEDREDWVTLATTLHGGFGSYVALGVYIGLDALQRLDEAPRAVEVTVGVGPKAPCPCVADGLQLSTGATVGRGSLRIATPAPADVFAIVTVRSKAGRTLRYTVPIALRAKLDQWNTLPASQRLEILRTVPEIELFTLDDTR